MPDGLVKMPEEKLEIVDSPDLPPLWEAFGARKRGDGAQTLEELADDVASPDGALHIGPQHVLLETAAMDLATALVGTDRLQMCAWHVMFLARGKAGPFRVEGEVHRGTGSTVGVHLTLHDEGNADRKVTAASALLEVV